jgi:hypothetical protein
MPLQATSGAASYDAFGGGVASVPTFVEDVFSPYLYAGSSSNKTIVNGINLSEKGGLVWMKSRIDYTTTGYNHTLYDTARGNLSRLSSNTTSAADTGSGSTYMSSFNNNGFTLVGNGFYENYSPDMVSWTFRKQPKFFDVVTWTGTGANRTIAHALNSEVGFIVVKRTDASSTWVDYHRGFPSANYYSQFGTTGASYYSDSTVWNDTAPTSSVFSLGSSSLVNASGGTYVAYLFAHNAGGFGLNGTDNVIVCGTADTAWSNITVDCGFEPQFVMARVYERTGPWRIFDNMRKVAVDGNDAMLRVDQSYAEDVTTDFIDFTSTGFVAKSELVYSGKLFYIAIRRGPMKVPTLGTTVYNTVGGSGANPAYVAGFPVDLALRRYPAAEQGNKFYSRLTGTTYLDSTSTAAEVTDANGKFDYQNAWFSNPDGAGYYSWMWRRAPSFFDEVCYTGTGVARTVAHNLAAVPELMIVKKRNDAAGWAVWSKSLPSGDLLQLNTTDAKITNSGQFTTNSPTSNVFYVGTEGNTNQSTYLYVAYLFATCAGVSKVGSYTGTATTLQVNCGFTAGARFVLIKRTDSTGDWYVWDSARGIVAGNDPYLLLNSTAAEVTNTDYVDTYSAGFEISSTAPAAINASGGSFIFLAIA